VVEYASSLLEQIERDSAEDVYAVLAVTKTPSMPSCRYCGMTGYDICPKCR
jgi:hypothetical protein